MYSRILTLKARARGILKADLADGELEDGDKIRKKACLREFRGPAHRV